MKTLKKITTSQHLTIFSFAFLMALFLFSCSKEKTEDQPIPVVTTDLIQVGAQANSDFELSYIVRRGNDELYRNTHNLKASSDFQTFDFNIELQSGDKVTAFVFPNNQKTQYLRTKILFNGTKVAEQNKICHVYGGCTYYHP